MFTTGPSPRNPTNSSSDSSANPQYLFCTAGLAKEGEPQTEENRGGHSGGTFLRRGATLAGACGVPEQCSEHSWACSGHVAKISMLRLNIGSGKLSSCMLSIGLGPKCEQGKGVVAAPLALFAFGSEANAEHA